MACLRGEGYVPVAGGAKGSIQQRVQTFLGQTVTQCSFELVSDHFFSFGHTWTVFLFFCFILQFKFFPVFLGMKMYDNEHDRKETKIIQG